MERWPAKLIFHRERGPQVNEGANRTVRSETVSAAGRCDCGHLGSAVGQPLRSRPGKARGTANDLRKVFGVLLVAALAGILIMFLVKVAQKG